MRISQVVEGRPRAASFEARRPAVVNCAGIYKAVSDGDRLRLDGGRGVWRW